jgi:hypothetical protein
LLVIFEGPVDRPMSPEAATSVNTGRQSSTIGGAGRGVRNSCAFTHEPRGITPSGAKLARKATRMSSRSECAAKADSAAASERASSMLGEGDGGVRARGERQRGEEGGMISHST